MDKNKVRVIKISKQALMEFIYEKFVENQSDYLDINAAEAADYFEFDLENSEFIFCAIKSEDEKGNFLSLPKDIDLKKVIKKIPDTTDSMFSPNKTYYKEYTKEELIKISEV
ncbi:hypothetical protein [Ruminococcus flavefaciens]|uniref:hypothetical protein n=1 Tax=Ruminococcus flavefaciens TaxID=1265 RepID=UPI0026F15F4F|nr:hypothetical protein [Ruminococcus flavefaciens]